MITADQIAPIKYVAGRKVDLTLAQRQAIADQRNIDDVYAARQEKAEGFEAEAVKRIAAIEPAWNTRAAIETVAKVWPAIAAAAPAEHAKAMAIRDFAKTTARSEVDKLTDADAIRGLDETVGRPFGDSKAGWPN